MPVENSSLNNGQNIKDENLDIVEHNLSKTMNLEDLKGLENGNLTFDFEGNCIFMSYERDGLDWDHLSKSIEFSEQNSDGKLC